MLIGDELKHQISAAFGADSPENADKPASVTVLLRSPYLMTRASGIADGAESVDISTDSGKTFKPAKLADFSDAVRGQVSALAKVNFKGPLKSLKLSVTVQNNPGSLPYLSPGKNSIDVSAGDANALGDNNLVITYAYYPGFRSKSFEQLCLDGKEVAKQHNAAWASAPVVVQKTFSSKDLPAKFEIDIATPKDKFPVYPRMLFVRSELRAAHSKPLPVPDNAGAPSTNANDELKTLPNPFMIGTQLPQAAAIHPTKVRTVDLKPSHFAAKDGTLPTTDFIKWPKNTAEEEKVPSIVLLIGGDLKSLPPLKNIVSARLVFNAVHGHESAAAKVRAFALKRPFEPGKKYDFTNLGSALGTVVVPKMNKGEGDWNPAKEFSIDVSRWLRSASDVANPANGIGLAILPDRSVDDGYTVRVNFSKQPSARLEITTIDNPESVRPIICFLPTVVNGGSVMSQQIPMEHVPLAASNEADALRDDGTHEVTPDLAYKRVALVNIVYFGPKTSGAGKWVLIDAGVPGMSSLIKSSADKRFEPNSRPRAIILTHGHFDHVGSLELLAEAWDVPIFAHKLEFPYLDGTASYPAPDPTVGGGLMSLLSPLYPRGPVHVSKWLHALPQDGSVPGMEGFTWIHTPGHSPGHVSFWREKDRTLLAGDAFITTNQESAYAVAVQRPEMHGPPMYYTQDWREARLSVEKLAKLAGC